MTILQVVATTQAAVSAQDPSLVFWERILEKFGLPTFLSLILLIFAWKIIDWFLNTYSQQLTTLTASVTELKKPDALCEDVGDLKTEMSNVLRTLDRLTINIENVSKSLERLADAMGKMSDTMVKVQEKSGAIVDYILKIKREG